VVYPSLDDIAELINALSRDQERRDANRIAVDHHRLGEKGTTLIDQDSHPTRFERTQQDFIEWMSRITRSS
jgi:hypothetical protein